MRCPVVDNSRSSPVLTQGLPCGVFCDKLEKNLQGSDRMSLREKLLWVAPEEWENEFVRPPRPDRYDPRRRDAHDGGRAPAPL